MDSMRAEQLYKMPQCMSEYDDLEEVLLCSPIYMEIKQIINETQKHFAKENISQMKAVAQHKQLIQTLKENQVRPILLPANDRFPEQVFTRDIGFTIGHTLFVSSMAAPVRQGEEQYLKEWAQAKGWSAVTLTDGTIEGGDVLVDQNRVFVGTSKRTSPAAIYQLKKELPDHDIIPIHLPPHILHLDCVMNILSHDEIIIYPEAFKQKDLQLLKTYYDLIEISEQEQFTLGPNVLSIGQKKVISLPSNQETNAALTAHGYTVIEVDFSEIIKSGGSFRCCTLPIRRSSIKKASM
ncbi:dimethylarginine dimethylaminohydrolase family protein [Bacillus safensis]|nr:dimethylarginine dimethylaminohydrolase family protein [Bacillus safensis]MBU8603663.1 dimethylarginine dimethylaminohydrolase family protein [Bacillus safensis]MBU8614912.1 dimethylarginine dimethylaminohydrolase family protein [Bacillus safensis]MBU8626101.1 dimethylarginine dimethylaminohydrolase family protein [Bacillus safensis]MDF1458500.1 dimethylarginine dimethylaminohydrolase family protein [Bacillus safensis]